MGSADFPIGSHWEEKVRPGHIVEIMDYSLRVDFEYWVTYKHIGVYNKRAQRFPTTSLVKNFRRRFKRVDR